MTTFTYTIRAHKEEDSVLVPLDRSSTGNYELAKDIAEEFAEYYGAAVICNNNTGNRIWYKRQKK